MNAPVLCLSAKRASWRMNEHGGEADLAFAAARKTTLDLAERRCVFCALRADKWQEVHHLDDDHHNQAQSNLICACPLCHQVFHLGLAGLHDGGDIIYAPEFSQAQLNALTLSVWLAVAAGGEHATVATQVYEELRNRNFPVTSIFREWAREANIKLAEPFRLTADMLANGLLRLDEPTYNKRGELLGGLRLLPNEARFREQIKHWVTYFGKTMPAADWHRLADISQLVANA